MNLSRNLPVLPCLLSLLTTSQPLSAQVASHPYSREQYLELIAEYVNKTTNIYDGQWAYSYTNDDKLEQEIITRRIDPGKPFMASDVILSVNGQPPPADMLERHQRRMERRLHRLRSRDRANNMVDEELERQGREKERFLALIIRDSLALIQREGNIHTLRFRGMEENRRNIYEHLEGFLVLDTEKEYIRELRIRVSEPFSPFFLGYINEGSFSIRFGLENGVPVQTDASWYLDGHILYLKPLEREEEIEWTDITPVVTGDGT